MVLEALLLFVGFYLFIGISIYIYSVVKSYEILGFWCFDIAWGRIGICTYPKWTLFWLETIVDSIRNWRNKK